MRLKKLLLCFLLSYGLLVLVAYLSPGGLLKEITGFVNWYITPLLPVILGIFTLKYFGIKSSQGKSIFFITLTLFLWLIGDLLWDRSNNHLGISDLFYLVSYPVFVVAIHYGVLTVDPDIMKEKKKVAIVVSSILLLVGISGFLFGEVIFSSLPDFIFYYYFICDLIVLILTVTLLFSIKGNYSSGWLAVGVGIIMTLASDIYFSFYYKVFNMGTLAELGWSFGYILFSIAFILLKDNAQRAVEKLKPKAQ